MKFDPVFFIIGMVLSFLATVALLSGCTVVNRSPMVPVKETYQVNVINIELCRDAWRKAVGRLYSEGIMVVQDNRYKKTFACISAPSIWYRGIDAVTSLLPRRRGFTQGDFAYAEITGYPNQDSKVIIHELMHLLKNEPHNWNGVMVPVTDLMIFYGGL